MKLRIEYLKPRIKKLELGGGLVIDRTTMDHYITRKPEYLKLFIVLKVLNINNRYLFRVTYHTLRKLTEQQKPTTTISFEICFITIFNLVI